MIDQINALGIKCWCSERFAPDLTPVTRREVVKELYTFHPRQVVMRESHHPQSSTRPLTLPEARVNHNPQPTEEKPSRSVLLWCIKQLCQVDRHSSVDRLVGQINLLSDVISRVSGSEVLSASVRNAHFIHIRTLLGHQAQGIDTSIEELAVAKEVQLNERAVAIMKREMERLTQPIVS